MKIINHALINNKNSDFEAFFHIYGEPETVFSSSSFESIKEIWSALLLQLQLVFYIFMLKETISNAINFIQPA